MLRNPFTVLFIGAALVAGLFLWRLVEESPNKNMPEENTMAPSTKTPAQVAIFAADPIKGPVNAPVTIVQFSDFTCPYCKEVAPLLDAAVKAGGVRLVWKDLPLPGHLQGQSAAEAAQCAARQNKFWEFHDALYKVQENFQDKLYVNLAESLNLSLPDFNSCMDNRSTLPLIQKNVVEAEAIGITSLPAVIINGRLQQGLFTMEQLTAAISATSAK